MRNSYTYMGELVQAYNVGRATSILERRRRVLGRPEVENPITAGDAASICYKVDDYLVELLAPNQQDVRAERLLLAEAAALAIHKKVRGRAGAPIPEDILGEKSRIEEEDMGEWLEGFVEGSRTWVRLYHTGVYGNEGKVLSERKKTRIERRIRLIERTAADIADVLLQPSDDRENQTKQLLQRVFPLPDSMPQSSSRKIGRGKFLGRNGRRT